MKNILKALMLSLLFMINTGVIEAQVDDSKAKITFLFIDKDVQGSISDIQTDIKIDKSIVSNSYMKGSKKLQNLLKFRLSKMKAA